MDSRLLALLVGWVSIALHPVIPLLVYHGQEEWRAATDFGELFAGEEALRPYWPRFRCELYDLARLDDVEIGGALRLQIVLLVMKYIFDPALRRHLADIFALFRDLSEDQPAVEYLRTVLYYIGNAARHLEREEMVTIVQQTLADEGNEVMETIAEQWIQQGVQQGLQQGLQQGMEAGVEQGLREAILDILLIRFDLVPREVEERLTAVTNTDQLRDLHRQAVTAESLDDFTDLLPQN